MMNSAKIIIVASAVLCMSACGATDEVPPHSAEQIQPKIGLPADYLVGQQTLKVAQSFLNAAGSGDMEALSALMADDFVWHNEGDSRIPWIGNWEGKDTVLIEFLPAFGAGLQTTSWETDYSMASGDQAVFIGTMSAIANNSGAETDEFSWAVRVNVKDGKVKSWNWFEDSYAVSKAYHEDSD